MEYIADMIISEQTQFLLSITQIAIMIIMTWRLAIVYSDQKSKISDNCSEIEKHQKFIEKQDTKIEQLESENNLIKITTAVLNTKLESIESGVVEIKAMLTRHIDV